MSNSRLEELKICLTSPERIECLKEIRKRNKRILFVYEKSLEKNSNYDYLAYVRNVVMFVSTANELIEGKLASVKVNLCNILNNNLAKDDIRKIVLENNNFLNYILKSVGEE